MELGRTTVWVVWVFAAPDVQSVGRDVPDSESCFYRWRPLPSSAQEESCGRRVSVGSIALAQLRGGSLSNQRRSYVATSSILEG